MDGPVFKTGCKGSWSINDRPSEKRVNKIMKVFRLIRKIGLFMLKKVLTSGRSICRKHQKKKSALREMFL
jgi:hypothetical protein